MLYIMCFYYKTTTGNGLFLIVDNHVIFLVNTHSNNQKKGSYWALMVIRQFYYLPLIHLLKN